MEDFVKYFTGFKQNLRADFVVGAETHRAETFLWQCVQVKISRNKLSRIKKILKL